MNGPASEAQYHLYPPSTDEVKPRKFKWRMEGRLGKVNLEMDGVKRVAY